MLTGKSVFHIEQGKGKYYKKNSIAGYYNDLTGKVSQKTVVDEKGIPITTTIAGIKAYFPIAIFQYGLGLYDMYLETRNTEYLKKFLSIANWAIDNIKENGIWDCMGTLKDSKHETQSSMCQGEGISILIRAHHETKEKKYLDAAKKAIEIMIKDVDNGGTCSYKNNQVIFQEYVSKSEDVSVLNGWIFSIFGLYDYYIYTKDRKIESLLNKTIMSLMENLKKYDRGYWTNYDQVGTISSPSYHKLHVELLKALYELTNEKTFINYAEKWKKYEKKRYYKIKAILVKIVQKINKNKYYDINTSTV